MKMKNRSIRKTAAMLLIISLFLSTAFAILYVHTEDSLSSPTGSEYGLSDACNIPLSSVFAKIRLAHTQEVSFKSDKGERSYRNLLGREFAGFVFLLLTGTFLGDIYRRHDSSQVGYTYHILRFIHDKDGKK